MPKGFRGSPNDILTTMLRLLKSVNGGAVSYDIIRAVCWPEGNAPSAIYYYISILRSETGLGIVHHAGVGYRLEPALDQHWAIKNPGLIRRGATQRASEALRARR